MSHLKNIIRVIITYLFVKTINEGIYKDFDL